MKLAKLLFITGCLGFAMACQNNNSGKAVNLNSDDENQFVCKEIGWKMRIPDGWKQVSKEQGEKVKQKGTEALEQSSGETFDNSKLRELLHIQKNERNLFVSTIEAFQPGDEEAWKINNSKIKKMVFQAYLNYGVRVDSSSTKIEEIGGRKFRTYSYTLFTSQNDTIMNQTYYCGYINGFDFGIVINYDNQKDRMELLSNWRQSNFK